MGLRTVFHESAAEGFFQYLFFELPINYSTSEFAANFNARVYSLFSDWMAHM